VNAAPDDLPALPGAPLLLDVTIRDGGYVNGHEWTVPQARSVVRTVAAAGIPFTEVGYLREAAGGPLTPSARCEPDYLEALAQVAGGTGLTVMIRPGEVSPRAVKSLAGVGVRMVRVLAARLGVDAALPFVAAAAEEGLLPAVNLTHASTHSTARLAAAVERAARAGARIVYLADSNGSLYPHETAERVRAAVEAAADVAVGFHPHDNLGLAFANTLAALRAGARAVDASIGGIGKGAGNLRLELIAAHLVRHGGADLRLDPLMDDQVTAPVRLKMMLDAGAGAMMTGMLDVSLEQSRGFREQAVERGYDALLRTGSYPAPALGGTAAG
jgi:4-hydroxy 2-oxovalerate aldolase